MSNIRSEISTLAAVGFAGVLLCAAMLGTIVSLVAALLWALLCSALWILVWQQTHKRLHLNRPDLTSTTWPDLGWANRMTLMRGWLIAVTGGFLAISAVLHEHTILIWLAAAAYSIAAIFDRLDGFVARKTGRSSLLGAELDTVIDALGLVVAPLLALQLGKIHWSYLLVSVAYYLFVLGVHLRQRQNKPVYSLAPSTLRRSMAGFQMAYVAVVLWPPFDAELTVLAGFGFMLPLLIGFLLDWFVVSGRIDPYEPGTVRFFNRVGSLTECVLLPVLRVALVLGFYYLAIGSQWHTASLALACLGAMMMVTGLAGRTGATLLLMVLAWSAPLAVHEPVMLIMLFTTIAIVLLGCGRFSLWQADDRWVNRQDGA